MKFIKFFIIFAFVFSGTGMCMTDEKNGNAPAAQSMEEPRDSFVMVARAGIGLVDSKDFSKSANDEDDQKQFEEEKKIAINQLQDCAKRQSSPEFLVGTLVALFGHCYDHLKTLGKWITVRPAAAVYALQKLGIKVDDIKDVEGRTPFLEFLSLKRGEYEQVSQDVFCTLVDAGSDVAATDKSKKTALHYAAHNGFTWACLELLKTVAVDPVDAQDDTPLHLATRRSQLQVCHVLIASKADINAKNKVGLAPADYNPCLANI